MAKPHTVVARAAAALAAGDRAGALAALLEAWRKAKHPRIADVIDHVSNELTAQRAPIRGKTLAARTEAWCAVEERRDPADLGRLLAMPWPRTLSAAIPLMHRLLAWPADPRIAMAFARLAIEQPFANLSGAHGFHAPVARRIADVGDVRALELLRDHGWAGAGNERERAERALAANRPGELAAAVATALLPIEERYTAALRDAALKVAGEPAHLAAILAAPDDSGPRAVYGDWLQERGDPRGELIAIQLASSEDPRAIARERALLEQHGRLWAGALDAWFEPHGRRFEDGFFAGGTLLKLPVPVESLDPAWRLVRTIAVPRTRRLPDLVAFLDRPELRGVRVVHGVREQTAAALAASQPPRGLRELGFSVDPVLHGAPRGAQPPGSTVGADDEPALATCAGLPELAVLAIDLDHGIPAWLAGAPVLERIERLVLRVRAHLGELLEAIAARDGALREIVLVGRTHRGLVEDAGWRIALRRDRAPGPFSSVTARFRLGRGASMRHFAQPLVETLRAIPASWPRELAFDAGNRLPLDADERAPIAAALARFTHLTPPELPWTAAPPRTRRTTVDLDIYLRGPGLLDGARLPEVLRHAGELGERYDHFRVGKNNALHALGEDPLAALRPWVDRPRTDRIHLVRDGHRARLVLARQRPGQAREMVTIVELELGDRAHERVIEWLVGFASAIGFASGQVDIPGRPQAVYHGGPFEPPSGWLMLFGPAYARVLPAAAVALGCRVERAGDTIVVVTAPTTSEATEARVEEVRAHLRATFDAHLPDHLGYDFAARAAAALAPVAEALDLPPGPRTPVAVTFTRGDVELVADLSSPLTEPLVRVTLAAADGMLSLGKTYWTPAPTAAALDDALRYAAARCLERGAAWLERQR